MANSQIRTPELDKEQRELNQAIASIMFGNAAELLNAWLVVQTEYGPLVHGIGRVLARASAQVGGAQ